MTQEVLQVPDGHASFALERNALRFQLDADRA